MEEREDKGLSLIRFEAVSKFKSIRRAYRRGHVSIHGIIFPDRPFNNRTSKKGSRPLNEFKKQVYGQLKGRYSASC